MIAGVLLVIAHISIISVAKNGKLVVLIVRKRTTTQKVYSWINLRRTIKIKRTFYEC